MLRLSLSGICLPWQKIHQNKGFFIYLLFFMIQVTIWLNQASLCMKAWFFSSFFHIKFRVDQKIFISEWHLTPCRSAMSCDCYVCEFSVTEDIFSFELLVAGHCRSSVIQYKRYTNKIIIIHFKKKNLRFSYSKQFSTIIKFLEPD